MSDPAWLDAEEQEAWRGLIAVAMLLPGAIDAHLKALADLTNFDYFILAMVSEAPDGALRLRDLAASTNGSLSRLSHAANRLEARGLLRRRPDPTDARSTQAVLTDEGRAMVEAVAPAHVAHVRKLVFDHLDPQQVRQLRDLSTTLLMAFRGGPPGAICTP